MDKLVSATATKLADDDNRPVHSQLIWCIADKINNQQLVASNIMNKQ
jgi:hypothetical protein